MSLKIKVIDSLSLAGSANRVNEDTFGSNEHCVFVIDGATGLTDRQYMAANGSDAAWLVDHARQYLEENLHDRCSPRLVVAEWSRRAHECYFELASEHDLPRYAWPTASFALLYRSNGKLSFAGLGDCTLLVQTPSGLQTLNPLEKFAAVEAGYAARHLHKTGGFNQQKNLLDDPDTLDTLRQIRSLQNTAESGIWTLGLVPEAADHLHVEQLDVADDGSALLCSDGFFALVSDYQQYTSQSLLKAALAGGLQPLMEELRHIESVVDPDAVKYPRFKQNDDATAVLVSWSN